MSWSLRLVRMLEQELREPRAIVRKRDSYQLTGRLDIGVRFVDVMIQVPVSFEEVRFKPPRVICTESWMRSDPDWHNDRVSGLCWVLEDQWRDVMSWSGKSVSLIMSEGCDWLLNDVRNLISRHYLAHYENITSWQPEWDSWAHRDEGAREYERTKPSSTTPEPR